MKRTLTLTLAVAACGSLASAQTAKDIISRVDAAQKNARDVSFKVSGTANVESSSQKIDFDVKAIPAQSLARVTFNAPDSLADNVIVADKQTVRNYLYLTNQITETPLNKAAGQAGLGGVDFTQLTNTAALLRNYDVKLVGTTSSGGAKLYQLEASMGGAGDRTRVWITDAGWRPTRVQVLSTGGKVVADLNVTNYKVNAGLTVTALRSLPKDAQVIRR
ncbi:outer membrane lipoprotein carrier protein LolA [Deinococcus maricopensis]|uniref:Outer membrane lipoprotein carrier protein LolA n=1 Tax=Deinococcus maricopensis (strain DSM 21211 / LMG 22137 / NRRL B-23946 / LB-34) TaxID=709986 RepID=E8U9Y8_DEIML|nr:outer membrane lipoprotein carrier protein LolA [Deinococcus maricopensis]ADV67877.1 hypothetical protein Deima_2239 [Deinococcus maricopensis DSM 21211]